jgi:hypothetical protein
MPYGYDRLGEVLDLLAKIADTPELFNALSPESQAYLLSRPTLPNPEPATTLYVRTMKGFDAIANVVAEIVETPGLFNNLAPANREYLYEWFYARPLNKN